MKNTVARRIKVARAEQDISQAQLGEMIDVSPQNIARWEKGEINIGVESLARIAEALGKPIEWFFQPFQEALPKAAARRR